MTRNDLLEIANTVYINGGATERELVFAQTVAHAAAAEERERIKAANAPEIERINAYIKSLEDAVRDEREACAKMFDEVMPLVPFAQNDQGGCLTCGFTPKLAAAAIRARGNT